MNTLRPGGVGLVDGVRDDLAGAPAAAADPVLVDAVRRREPFAPPEEILRRAAECRAELVGAGPLQPLLDDPAVTDVLVNGSAGIWVDRGRGLQPCEVEIGDEHAVRRLAQRLAASAGRRLDDAQPWVDAQLPDGTRLHAVIPPLASGGTHVSLRTFSRVPLTLGQLVQAGALPAEVARLLVRLVRHRLPFLVSGSTGAGKTTLLAALLAEADPSDRVVIVEDAAELRPALPHVVRLQSRPANAEGVGAVSMRDLVRQALRMRPDRVVVGEVRGAEVLDLLMALNTGHEGGCGTVHANSAVDVPTRLEALGLSAGIGRQALHSLVSSSLRVVVHVDRGPDGIRRVAQLGVLTAGSDGLVRSSVAAERAGGDWSAGPAWPEMAGLLGLSAAGGARRAAGERAGRRSARAPSPGQGPAPWRPGGRG
jgi:pilus assembly protein CpaF